MVDGNISNLVAHGQPTLSLDRMQHEIEVTQDPRKLRAISAQAEVVRSLAKKARHEVEVINKAVEVKIRAMRRVVPLIDELRGSGNFGHGGDRRSSAHREHLKLSDLGIDHNELARCRLLSRIPQPELESSFKAANAEGREISTSGYLRLAKRYHQVAKKQPKRKRENVVYANEEKRLTECLDEMGEHLRLLQSLLEPVCDRPHEKLHPVQRAHIRRLVLEMERLLAESRSKPNGELA